MYMNSKGFSIIDVLIGLSIFTIIGISIQKTAQHNSTLIINSQEFIKKKKAINYAINITDNEIFNKINVEHSRQIITPFNLIVSRSCLNNNVYQKTNSVNCNYLLENLNTNYVFYFNQT